MINKFTVSWHRVDTLDRLALVLSVILMALGVLGAILTPGWDSFWEMVRLFILGCVFISLIYYSSEVAVYRSKFGELDS